MRGVFLDLDTMAPVDLDLTKLETVLPGWKAYDRTSPEQVPERVAGAQVVIVQKAVLDERTLSGAGHSLRLVCVAATGTNNVDLVAAATHDLPVCNVRNYAGGSVPQHVFTLILALVTRVFDYHVAVQDGRWPKSKNFCFLDYPIRELAGLTLGIVGFGSLGRAVGRIGVAFGMNVLVWQRPHVSFAVEQSATGLSRIRREPAPDTPLGFCMNGNSRLTELASSFPRISRAHP